VLVAISIMSLPLIIRHIDKVRFGLFNQTRAIRASGLWGDVYWLMPMRWDNMRMGVRRGIEKELHHG